MNRLYATVALDVRVDDLEALAEAARTRAAEDGLSQADWAEVREGPEDDLQMLLDPGALSNVGFEILGSSATLTHSTLPG